MNTTQATIEKDIWQGEPVIRFGAGGYEAVLIPGVGAQIIELKDVRRGLNLLRNPGDLDMEAFKARPQVYGIPILFPPNRIEDGQFEIAGKVVEFPINTPNGNNHIHGFLRTRAWQITKLEAFEDTVEIEAIFDGDQANDTYAQYLNEFEFKLHYTLSSAGLNQKLTITNHGENSLPIGVGFHTAFCVPFHPASNAKDCRLLVSVGKEWELTTERTLPTGKRFPLNPHDQAYRTEGVCAQGTPLSGHFTVQELNLGNQPFHGAIIEDKSQGLRLRYTVGPEYKHWMIWNDTGDKGFICPEPQTWMINAPNMKLPPEITGYQELQPGAIWTAESSIAIEEY